MTVDAARATVIIRSSPRMRTRRSSAASTPRQSTNATPPHANGYSPRTSSTTRSPAVAPGKRKRLPSGTHEGEFLGVEATGKIVDFTSTAVLRIEDDLIAQAWDEVDSLAFLRQVGRTPG